MPEPGEPAYAREARVQLGVFKTPPGPWIRPRHAAGETRWSDGTWRPCTIVAWKRLDEPREELMSGVKVAWLVRLQMVGGDDRWWGYRPAYLRPRRG